MNLHRKIALVLMVGVVTACHETSAPATPSNFILTSINGNQLPASDPLIPGSTVLAGSFFLDGAGLATVTEQRRDVNGTQSNLTTTYRYTIKGNVIEFDYYPSCPQGLCISLPKGTLADNHALIDFSSGEGLLIFDYILGGNI